jgi:carbonic anhydrase
VHADVELLRKAPELAGSIGKFRIGGHAHDLKTGLLTTVVDPS